jgi:hypothetical protein
LGTKVRPPLRDQGSPDRRATLAARFAGPLIDQMLVLEAALSAFRIHVIGDGRAFGGDGLGEHLLDGRMKLL